MGDFGNARTTAVLKTQPYAILLVPKAEKVTGGYSVIPEDFEIALKGFNSEDPDVVAQVAQLLRIAAGVLDAEVSEMMDKALAETLKDGDGPGLPMEDPAEGMSPTRDEEDEDGRMYAGD
jgi:hypothetical protein